MDIEGQDAQDGLRKEHALERQERTLRAVSLGLLQDVGIRLVVSAFVTNLKGFCSSLGGAPHVQDGVSICLQGDAADAERCSCEELNVGL